MTTDTDTTETTPVVAAATSDSEARVEDQNDVLNTFAYTSWEIGKFHS